LTLIDLNVEFFPVPIDLLRYLKNGKVSSFKNSYELKTIQVKKDARLLVAPCRKASLKEHCCMLKHLHSNGCNAMHIL